MKKSVLLLRKLRNLRAAMAFDTKQGEKWITVHPNNGKGRAVLIKEDGTIEAGMGGKFNGQKIDEIHKASAPKKTNGNTKTSSTKASNGLAPANGSATYYKNYNPNKIAGITRGTPMTWRQANGMKGNLNHGNINCQTCVVAFEARLRGYPVTARKNKNNSMTIISHDTLKAWGTDENGNPPAHLPKRKRDVKDENAYWNYLMTNIDTGKRYHLSMFWKSGGGHIICINKNAKTGHIECYDPQTGKWYLNKKHIMNGLLKKVVWIGHGFVPEVTRVDNLSFNPNYIHKILVADTTTTPSVASAE